MAERAADVQARRLVIGIGNPDRGDDGAGRLVAEMLRAQVPADVEVIVSDGEAAGLLEHLEGAAVVYLIDASVTGAPAGTVQRFDCATPLPPACLTVSTHGFGPAEAIELARALERLPPCCVVYAIEAAGALVGARLSGEVRRSAATVAERIAGELRGL